MDTKELTGLIISERLSLYFSRNRQSGIKETQRSGKFRELLEEKAPELTEEFEKYLDWLTQSQGEEQKKLYLFGVHDGIRLMRDIISAV